MNVLIQLYPVLGLYPLRDKHLLLLFYHLKYLFNKVIIKETKMQLIVLIIILFIQAAKHS